MSEEARTHLHSEADMLRAWMTGDQSVDEYDRWWPVDGVVGAVQRFLVQVQPDDWTDRDVADLLYLLEKSTTGYLAELVAQTEPMTIAIAKHSLARGGLVGDDIATCLAFCREHRDVAEILLLEFMKSAHERTRRVALLSLAALGSVTVPDLAAAAWTSGDEYQRIGALAALKTVGSDLYPEYLAQALVDGRENLMAFARRSVGEQSA